MPSPVNPVHVVEVRSIKMSEEIDYQPLNLIHMIKVRFDGKTIKLRQDQVCAKLVAKVFTYYRIQFCFVRTMVKWNVQTMRVDSTIWSRICHTQ